MKRYTQQTQPISRICPSAPQAIHQSSIEEILQQKTHTLPTSNSLKSNLPLQKVGMILLRQRNKEWSEVSLNETGGKEIVNLDELSPEGIVRINTAKLMAQDKEKLIELIAKGGQGALGRKIRETIGQEIYISADTLLTHLEELQDKFKKIADEGVEIGSLEIFVAELEQGVASIKTDKEKVIVDARKFGGLYAIRNKLSVCLFLMEKVLAKINSSKCLWPTAIERIPNVKVTFHSTLPEAEVEKQLLLYARTVREKVAYGKLPEGEQWKSEKLEERVPSPAKIGEAQKAQPSSIEALSNLNIQRLTKITEPFIGQYTSFIERFNLLNYTMKHATPAFYAIANTGILSSLSNLALWQNAQKASGMSSVKNTTAKGDGDFSFFRFGTDTTPMQTRYGPTAMVITSAIELLKDSGGWVSLHDQLVPLDRPGMRELKDKNGTVVRKSYHDETHTRSGMQTQWINEYTQSRKQKTISFLDEVFYGKDIRRGIILSIILEIERIGGQFKADALQMKDKDELGRLLSSIYRIEAKLPSSAKLSEAGLLIHNPEGDGRYYSSGIIHPEGMAASVAYTEYQSRSTLVNSMIAGYERVKDSSNEEAKRTAIKKVMSMMVKQRRSLSKALKMVDLFVKVANNERSQKQLSETKSLAALAVILKNKWELEQGELQGQYNQWGEKLAAFNPVTTIIQEPELPLPQTPMHQPPAMNEQAERNQVSAKSTAIMIGSQVRVRYHLYYDVVGIVRSIEDAVKPIVEVHVNHCYEPGTTNEFSSDHTAIVLNKKAKWVIDSVEIDTGH